MSTAPLEKTVEELRQAVAEYQLQLDKNVCEAFALKQMIQQTNQKIADYEAPIKHIKSLEDND